VLAAAVQQCRHAARAIAALLDLAAVGIEHAIEGVGAMAARRLQHQRLVETYAGVAIGEGAPLVAGGQRRIGGQIEDYEVVARPCILVKSMRMPRA